MVFRTRLSPLYLRSRHAAGSSSQGEFSTISCFPAYLLNGFWGYNHFSVTLPFNDSLECTCNTSCSKMFYLYFCFSVFPNYCMDLHHLFCGPKWFCLFNNYLLKEFCIYDRFLFPLLSIFFLDLLHLLVEFSGLELISWWRWGQTLDFWNHMTPFSDLVWFVFLRVPTFLFSVYIFTATQPSAGISTYLTILVIKILSLSLSQLRASAKLRSTYTPHMSLAWMSFAIFFHLLIQGKDILQYFSQLSALNNSGFSKVCHLITPASCQTICKCGIP